MLVAGGAGGSGGISSNGASLTIDSISPNLPPLGQLPSAVRVSVAWLKKLVLVMPARVIPLIITPIWLGQITQ